MVAGTTGDGPLTVGICHSDYSNTEVKECLESGASIDQGDKIAQEQGNRLVRIVGSMLPGEEENLNDGKPIKTRLNWMIDIGSAVNVFVYNEGSGSLTTGSLMKLTGSLYVKDSV